MFRVIRSINLVLSLWLMVSSFLWTHSEAQFTNAWMLGVVATVMAAFSIEVPQLRWVNGVLSLWLFVSAFALPHVTLATVWNSVIIAVLMFSVSVAETMGPVSDQHVRR